MKRRRATRKGVRNEPRGPGRTHRWLRALLRLGAPAAGIGLGILCFEPLAAHFAPHLLAVDEISVLGAVRTSPAELRGALALRAGTPVLSPDRAELERRLETHPWVRSARVALVRPGRLIAEVTEREATAVTRLGQPPTAWLVDRDGTPFAPAGAEAARHPGVAGPPDAQPGVADARLREGVRIARALAAHRLGAGVLVEVAGAPAAELPALRLAVGPRVLLGPGELDRKLARLDALLEAGFEETRRAQEIDLRFGDRMVLRGDASAGAGAAAAAGGDPAPPWTGSAG